MYVITQYYLPPDTGTQQSNQPIARPTTKQPVVPSSRSSS